MRRDHSFFQWLSDGMDLPLDAASRKCIVEIAEDKRVLVENHQGVIEYCNGCIGIKVSFGLLKISGCGLELIQMTNDQLVIAGKIEEVKLIRRKSP